MKERNLPQGAGIFLVILGLSFLWACSIPKISILKDPLTGEEHLNLGVVYERQGDYENAIREYQMAAKEVPRASLCLGNAHFQKGDYAQAEKCYKRALIHDPQDSDALNNLAWLYYTRRVKLAAAEDLAQQAIQINPQKEAIYLDTLNKIREAMKKSGE